MRHLQKYYLAIFIILSFSFYIVYVFYINPPWHNGNPEGYIGRAASMASGISILKADTFYPVGMTYLLAPFFYFFNYGLALRVIAIFYALLLTATNYLTFKIVLDFYKSKNGAWFALIFCSLYFPFIAYIGFYLSEIPFAFFLVLSLYLFCRSFHIKASTVSSALLAGLIFGFASIIKGTLFPALIFLVILLCFQGNFKKNYPKIAIFCLGFLYVISAQAIRNSFIMDRFTPFSTNGGVNMYLGQAHVSKIVSTSDFGNWWWVNPNCVWDKSLAKEEQLSFDYWDDNKFYDKVKLLWRNDPIKQTKISLHNGMDLFHLADNHWFVFDSESENNLNHKYHYLLIFLIYIPLLASIIYMFKNKKNRFLNLIFLSPIASVLIMAMATKGEERYLIPFQYLMVILVAPFWAKLLSQVMAKINRKLK